jgi:hypothetical protein
MDATGNGRLDVRAISSRCSPSVEPACIVKETWARSIKSADPPASWVLLESKRDHKSLRGSMAVFLRETTVYSID